jgi:hypothetical protein
MAQVIKLNPSRFAGAPQPLKRMAPTAVKALADEFLAQNHMGEPVSVQLAGVWPRNELELVADMLYEHTALPLRTLQERIAAWPVSRKLAVFEAYLSDSSPGPVLEKAHYSWDLLAAYDIFRELQLHPTEDLEIQPLTPRFGYDVPALLEEAGLSDTYEKCFDLSLELYSAMQQAGHHQEAQYATLQGHRQRWKMTLNARQMLHLLDHAHHSPAARQLLEQMREKLTEAHPTIAETA